MNDLSLIVDPSLARHVAGEVPRLLLEAFNSKTLWNGGGARDVEIGVDGLMASRFEARLEIPEFSDLIEAHFVEAVCEAGGASRSEPDREQLLLGEMRRRVGDDRGHVRAELTRAFSDHGRSLDLRSEVTRQLARGLEVEVSWVRLWVGEGPLAVPSNPIELRDLELVAQARLRPWVKLFGKSRCLSMTTPAFRHDGATLELALSTRPPIVHARPAFRDLDLVFHSRVFGAPFEIRIGLTRTVNRALARQAPLTVLDTRNVPTPARQRSLRDAVRAIAMNTTPRGSAVDIDREVG